MLHFWLIIATKRNIVVVVDFAIVILSLSYFCGALFCCCHCHTFVVGAVVVIIVIVRLPRLLL